MTTGDVEITIADGGAGVVVVPGSTVQVKMGPATSGPLNQVVATRNPNTLASVFGGGPLVESGALTCLAGGTVLAMRTAQSDTGAVSAVTATRVGSSTCVVSVTGDPTDEFYFKLLIVKAGAIATNGITFKLSLDAGRSYGPTLALGTANTYAVPGTGLTLNFASGSLEAGDYFRFGTTPPLTDTGGVLACVDALKASQYAGAGWGSFHIANPFDGADAADIQGYLEALSTENHVYTRAMIELRDVSPAAVWGGDDETEAEWLDALGTDVSALDAKRICPNAGNYNMSTAFPTAKCGTPRYRRNVAWAHAARAVKIPPQRHSGRVRDGSLSNIVLDPTNDPVDGFVYHNEALNPGLTAARITGARLRSKPGFYITDPLLSSAPGSVFTLLPLGNVMDIGCSLVFQTGEDEINDDIRLNDNGTIHENEAQRIESVMLGVLNANMTAKNMISSARITIDRSNNVRATSEVNVNGLLFSRGYILQLNITIGYASPFAAGG